MNSCSKKIILLPQLVGGKRKTITLVVGVKKGITNSHHNEKRKKANQKSN